jgi:cell division protein FtsL
MISILQTYLTKILIVLAISSVVFGSISFYGYRTTKLELESLQTQYKQLKIDYDTLEKDRDTIIAKNEITDSTVVDLQQSLDTIESEKDVALAKLKELSKRSCPKPIVTPEGEVIETVDINMPFSDEYRNAIRLSAPNP